MISYYWFLELSIFFGSAIAERKQQRIRQTADTSATSENKPIEAKNKIKIVFMVN